MEYIIKNYLLWRMATTPGQTQENPKKVTNIANALLEYSDAIRRKWKPLYIAARKTVSFAAICIMAAGTSGAVFSQNTRYNVAVVDFANNSGNTGLDFLSRSIADSVSSTFGEEAEFRLVERSQMNKLLEEVELQQSGLFEDAVMDNLSMVRADYLIVGSYTGKSSRLNVNIRMVNVATSEVLATRTVHGSVDDLFEKIEVETRALFQYIRGAQFGSITVTSQPDEADVYVDGVRVGQTPLVNYKVVTGNHTIKIRKQGFSDFSDNVVIRKGKVSEISPLLQEIAARNLGGIYGGVNYLVPFDDVLQPAMQYSAGLFYQFGVMRIQLDAFFTDKITHNYDYTVPYNTVTDQRKYQIITGAISIIYQPFVRANYFSPYIGAFGGYTLVDDLRVVDLVNQTAIQQEIITYGPIAGISILPYGGLRLFLEGRYHLHSNQIERSRIELIEMGGKQTIATDMLDFQYYTIGGGLCVQF